MKFFHFEMSSSAVDEASAFGVGDSFVDSDDVDDGVSDADVIVDAVELSFSLAFRRFFIMMRLLFSITRPSIWVMLRQAPITLSRYLVQGKVNRIS